jgi:hypothetical protein
VPQAPTAVRRCCDSTSCSAATTTSRRRPTVRAVRDAAGRARLAGRHGDTGRLLLDDLKELKEKDYAHERQGHIPQGIHPHPSGNLQGLQGAASRHDCRPAGRGARHHRTQVGPATLDHARRADRRGRPSGAGGLVRRRRPAAGLVPQPHRPPTGARHHRRVDPHHARPHRHRPGAGPALAPDHRTLPGLRPLPAADRATNPGRHPPTRSTTTANSQVHASNDQPRQTRSTT